MRLRDCPGGYNSEGTESNTSSNAHLRNLLMQNQYPSPRKSGAKKKPSKRIRHKDSSKQQGLIFIWPQKKRIYLNYQNVKRFACVLAHTLYWLHVTNILPSGPGLSINEPLWEVAVPVRIPVVSVLRNNIIEPDWDSK